MIREHPEVGDGSLASRSEQTTGRIPEVLVKKANDPHCGVTPALDPENTGCFG
jgi:hypothetical protein